jgi:antitoxin MazE
MKVARWGNSLAVRIPGAVADALELKEGDELDIQIVGKRAIDLDKADLRALLARLRKFRGRMPADFKFDRLEAHARD